MKKRGKLLLVSMLVTFSLLIQVFPAFASVDGNLMKVTPSSLSMRTGPGIGYGITMTMGYGEALADKGGSTLADGYDWGSFLGWKSSIGSTVTGFVARNYLSNVWGLNVKQSPLNLYATDTSTSWSNTIPAYSTGLGEWDWETYVDKTYNNLKRIAVEKYTPPGGTTQFIARQYVNTNFQSSSPSSYYVTLP